MKPMPTTHRHHGHGAPWHAVLWISIIAVVFSATTITLSAMAQGTSQGYPKNTEGVLRAISDLRKDIREVNARVQRLENKIIGTTAPQKTQTTTPTESANTAP